MTFLAVAVGGAAVLGYASSRKASKNARAMGREQNDANLAMTEMANEMEMERYYQSRGAAMGATYAELTAKPFKDDGSPNEDYDPNLSMFNADGSAKNSAVLPLYLSQLETDMADDYQETYSALGDRYDGLAEYDRIRAAQQGLAPSEQGYLNTINDVYDGTELAEGGRYLDTILNTRQQGVNDVQNTRFQGLVNTSNARFTGAEGVADSRLLGASMNTDARLLGLDQIQQERLSASQAQAQAILNEGQRNAAQANFTGKTGVVGNSGNAQAATLAALMNAYSDAGVNAANNRVLNAQDAADVYLANAEDFGTAYLDNSKDLNQIYLDNAADADNINTTAAEKRAGISEQDALSRFALYEQNLANRKDGSQITAGLNTISQNATAGLNTVYADKDATNASIQKAGMQIGQGNTPQVNVPSYQAAPRGNTFADINSGIQSGVSGYLLANAISNAGGFGGGGAGAPSQYPSTIIKK
jgi:hypothetical protein